MEFLKTVLIEPFEDGIIGCVMGLLMWGLLLVLALLMGLGVLRLANNVNQQRHNGIAIVEGKLYTPAHTTTIYVTVGKSMIPQTTYYDESFTVTMSIDEESDDVCISEGFYLTLKKGDKYQVSYVQGRITGSLYIKEINEKVE